MKSIIEYWYGRAGNNFIQLINCIYYSFYINNYEYIQFPNHSLFTENIILNKENKDVYKSDNKIKKDTFFYANKLGFRLEPYKMREISQKYLVNKVNMDLSYKENNDLCIHIRGGDAMNSKFFFLLQNPMKLISKVLKDNNYDNIKLVYEDMTNPVVFGIKRLNHPKITFQSSTIQKDIETLCQGKHFLACFSTFSMIPYYLSTNLKHLLIPEFMINEWYNNTKWNIPMTIFTFQNYTIDNWKQLTKMGKQKLLLTYDGEITSYFQK